MALLLKQEGLSGVPILDQAAVNQTHCFFQGKEARTVEGKWGGPFWRPNFGSDGSRSNTTTSSKENEALTVSHAFGRGEIIEYEWIQAVCEPLVFLFIHRV